MALPGGQLCRCDLEARIGTYGALADVLGGAADEVQGAVVSLRRAGSWCSLAYFDDDAIQAACAEAERAARDPHEVVRFLEERRAVIGHERFDPFMHRVSPCGATYVTDKPEDLLADLAALYGEAGYVVHYRVPCESHIAVELDYMRFLLERVRAGDEEASKGAADFFVKHISGWSLLFAVAFGDAVQHPISRCVALRLDRFLSCEENVVRHSVPSNCIQCRLAGAD